MPITEIDFYEFVKPRTGHMQAGDLVFFEEDELTVKLAIIDGVGHGGPAHEVAVMASKQLSNYFDSDLVETLKRLNTKLTGTVGAAVGLCLIDKAKAEMSYCGVGNTVARKMAQEDTHFVSIDGTIGLYMRTPKVFKSELERGDVLVFHTDGISAQYNRRDFPRLTIDRARTVAESLLGRFSKAHDDAGCAVLKIKQ
jgi:serine phosphatase RsbU (regulator of sigma subunit)